MTDFQFFTQTEFTDRSILPIFASETAQNNYFDSLTKITKTGVFKPFQNPILVYSDIEDIIPYSYFRFKFGDKWYYAVVADLQQNAPGKTEIYYRIDYWQTCRHQFGITLGRGYVSRSSHAPEGLAHRDSRYTIMTKVFDYTYVCLVFFARDHETNENYIGIIYDWTNEAEKIFNSTWINDLDIDPADIIGAWFMPFAYSYTTLATSYEWTRYRDDEMGTPIQNSTVLSKTSTATLPQFPLFEILTPTQLKTIKTTNTKSYVIRDMDGSVVYQFGFGRDYSNDGERGLYGIFDISPTSCCVRVITGKVTDSLKRNAQNKENICSIYGQSLDFFVDAYDEYFARNRDFDLQVRANNISKSISSAVGSAGSAAVEGALSGALIGAAGGPVGATGGAAVGAISGIATSAISGFIDATYNNPKEQAALDQFNKQQVDTLGITGSHLHLLSLMAGSTIFADLARELVTCFGIYQVDIDGTTADQITEDLSTYGNYCSIPTNNGESWIIEGALKGEFIVKGDIPETWKAAIQQNIASGITIKKYGVWTP